MHLYDNSELVWRLHDGNGIRVVQSTRYPWDGDVQMEVTPEQPAEFAVHLRIPAWSARSTVLVSGERIGGAEPGQYLAIRRAWKAGDRISLSLDMTPQRLRANPAVTEDTGRVAFQRGPVVFCMEGLDQSDRPSQSNMVGFSVKSNGNTTAHYDPNLLDGVVTLQHEGSHQEAPPSTALYFAANTPQQQPDAATLKLIPYYAWANREPSEMQVWIPERRT